MSDIAPELRLTSILEPDADPEAFYLNEPTSAGWGGDNGGPAVVTAFERDVQSLFDPNQVVWSDDNAANLSNGWTFSIGTATVGMIILKLPMIAGSGSIAETGSGIPCKEA